MSREQRFRLLCLRIALVFLGLLFGYEVYSGAVDRARFTPDYRAHWNGVQTQVQVGMQLDGVISKLRADGFDFGDPYFPTESEDYLWSDFSAEEPPGPLRYVVRYLCGHPTRMLYITLESGEDRLIRRVLPETLD